MLGEALFYHTLESSLGRLLAVDPGHTRLLRPIAGRVIAVELQPGGIRFYFSPTAESLLVLPDYAKAPDVVLRGSPLSFIRMLLSERPESALFQGVIEVEGDIDVARRLQILLHRLDLDWNKWLAERAGADVAKTAQGLWDWHRQTWRTFQWNLGEFLQEETRALPAPLEAEDLYRRLACLRDDVARLEARLQRLQARVRE